MEAFTKIGSKDSGLFIIRTVYVLLFICAGYETNVIQF